MSQILRTRYKKDGSAKGVAIRKTNATSNNNTLKTLFNMAYTQHVKKKNVKSKSKVA